MNRDEKNLQTRRKIIDSALREFGEKSYAEASMNTICAEGGVSKGIVYHYFKDKDELYLVCAGECFDALTEHLRGAAAVSELPIQPALERYFDARVAFFHSHPLYLGLFCGAVMNPPGHLSDALREVRAAFDAQSVALLTALLRRVKLRADVSTEDVIEVFREYQDFVNAWHQRGDMGENTLMVHEARCRRSLGILLYGVIEREEAAL